MKNQGTTARFHRRQRGFTLTEVLIATTVFTIIVIAALMIYDRSNQIFKSSVESGDMQQNTRAGFDRLVSDVRMAGFDYDRDGVPTRAASGPWQPSTTYTSGAVVSPVTPNGFSYQAITGGTSGAIEPNNWPTTAGNTISGDGTVTWRALGPVFQQVDEQIEYAGRSAIVVRANYDYHLDVAHEHGRENVTGANYEPTGGQFPVVTTANDEIVIYALRSDAGSNPDTLSFFADVSMPRSVYPGGNAEEEVELANVDLCATGCNNPPYTLYRFTLKTDGTPDAGTPIANNVRDLQFRYYTDIAGTTLLTKLDGTAVAYGAIGGAGQWDPANVAGTDDFDDRASRATILAISVQLTGMSAAPDPKYDNPAETIASVRKYRQYTLESHVTPRNLGLAGMAEPSGLEPGPPTITSVCVGSCRVTRVTWAPPLSGTVRTYEVLYDTSVAGDFDSPAVVVPGDVFSAPVMNLTPGTTYYFKVHATNENGESSSAPYPPSGIVVANTTKPAAVTDLTATQGTDAEANQVTLTWTVPSTNVSPLNTLTCAGGSLSGSLIDAAEPIRYRIWRGTSVDFDPSAGEGEVVLDNTVGTQPGGIAGTQISWVDDLTNSGTKPPANCKNYWYRIQVYDTCSVDAATATSYNTPAVVATGSSAIYPDVSGTPEDGIPGYASSTVAPSAPGQPSIDYTNNYSKCNKGLNSCDVRILWPKVTTDTSNPTATITVDQYRIRRERKKAADTTWVFDTYLPIVNDASSDPTHISGNNVVAHDTSALDHDPVDKRKWYYRYTISALQCGTEGAASPTIEFPESCGLASSTVIESGAASGNGSLESPWVMNASDTIQVIPPVSVQLDEVQFEIYPEPNPDPNAQPADDLTVSADPFVYSWNDQSDGAVYRVVITMTNAAGCTEQTERFIQDDPVSCPSSTVSQTGASSGGGTEASPWVMNAGDTVFVNEPGTGTIANVKFDLYDDDTGAVILSSTDATAPYGGSWTNQVDGKLYRLEMDVTFTEGCTQEIIRYIQDEPPPVCTGASVSVTGDVSGNNGAAQATPWMLNGGDVLTVNAPTGGTINQVVFTITPVSPAASALPAISDSASPFQLTWSDQTDNTIYRVDAVITYATGCTETETVYVQDQLCSGATTAASGSTGSGTGLTSVSPWIFNAGDTVTVTPPASVTVQGVEFVLKQGASTISTSTDTTSPYVFTWANQTDNAAYTLTINVTYTAGCVETLTRYIQDQGQCFISLASVTPVITHADSGARRIATITYTINNPEAEALTLSGVKVNWARDAGHPTAVVTSVIFTSGATSVPETIGTSIDDPPTTGLVTLTSSPPLVPASNSAYTVAVTYDLGKKTDVGDLSSSWISGLCLQYTAPSFGGVSANCNLLGSTAGNPNSCN